MAYWAAAFLHRHRENLALGLLKDRGFETYWPRIRERRIVRGRHTVVPVALFPGYVFIAIALRWYDIHSTPGVRQLIMFGPQPARVPDDEIEKLRTQENDEGFVVLPEHVPALPAMVCVGSQVRVCNGPLFGFSGLVTGMSAQKRIKVLLQMLGSFRNVDLALSDVSLA